jgi:hypothetical protein
MRHMADRRRKAQCSVLVGSCLLLLGALATQAKAQGISEVEIKPSPGGVAITVRLQQVAPHNWVGISVRRPNGTVDDLPPAPAATADLIFNYPGPRCGEFRGYAIAAALWRGYDHAKKEMTGLTQRFRNTIWVPTSCPVSMKP